MIEVIGDAIEVHRAPAAKGYRDMARVGRGGSISPLSPKDLSVRTEEILG